MPRLDTRLTKKDLQEGKPIRVDLDSKPILLVLVAGKVYAMDAVCSHEGGPLEERIIEGYSLTCPWHAAIFDIRSAKTSSETRWATDLQSYPVFVDDKSGRISIDTDSASSASREDSRTSDGTRIEQENAVTAVLTRDKEALPLRPLKMQLKLLAKILQEETDIMSFKFSCSDGQNYLNYKVGQYSIIDLGTKDDPKDPIQSFTIASSPTEKESILITMRIRESPFKGIVKLSVDFVSTAINRRLDSVRHRNDKRSGFWNQNS